MALDLPSTDTNLASPCREVLHFSITLYRSVSRVADQVGARWVTVQTGHCHKRLATPGDLLSDVLAESLRTRCDDAQRLGLEIHVENVSGTMIEADREAVDFRDARDLF
ncbi:MAG: hypothetical protein IT516_08530 [Burkholderiales bacterium]|nr:hypothetical protein [Burkholderiales bacterium]